MSLPSDPCLARGCGTWKKKNETRICPVYVRPLEKSHDGCGWCERSRWWTSKFSGGLPRVEGWDLRGNFNTQNWCFLYLQISVDLSGISGNNPSFRIFSGNLKRLSEFPNMWKKVNARFVAPSICCKPFPLHPWLNISKSFLFSFFLSNWRAAVASLHVAAPTCIPSGDMHSTTTFFLSIFEIDERSWHQRTSGGPADACDTYSRICGKYQGVQDVDDDELNGENGYPDGECTCITCKECEIIYKEEDVQSRRYQDRLEVDVWKTLRPCHGRFKATPCNFHRVSALQPPNIGGCRLHLHHVAAG